MGSNIPIILNGTARQRIRDDDHDDDLHTGFIGGGPV